MRTFKFFQDKKFYEDLGHFCIGFIPFLGWWREQDQWPPGDTIWVRDNAGPPAHVVGYRHEPGNDEYEPHAPHDRVGDAYRDFLGYACGDVARTLLMLGVIIWLAVR